MIKFEIIQSTDTNVLTTFNFMSNQIFIGKKTGDLIINDYALNNSHVMIEVVGNDLLIHPQKDVAFFLINGKRATSVRKLRQLEEITIGNTKIKILAYEEGTSETKKSILDKKFSKLIEANSKRLTTIEKLSKLSK